MNTLVKLAICAAVASGAAAQADTLQKIKDSGVVKLGVRTDNGGLSYAISEGKYGGFHVDLCLAAVADIEKQLAKKLKVEMIAVTSQTRIPSVINGTVDMECGATTNNATRQKDVAFAVTTFVEEVRTVVRADSGITSISQLNGKTVATVAGTTSVPLLRKHERGSNVDLKEVIGKSDAASFALVAEGKADAYVMDGQIVAAFISGSKNPAMFRLLDEVLSVEPIAIMLRKDDPGFKTAVDGTIKALIKSGEINKLYSKWFTSPIPPNQVTIGLPLSSATKKAWADPNDRPVETY
ncbi:MAG: transporter substrate-binding domain-containing protein [Burkholderiales bacterium]